MTAELLADLADFLADIRRFINPPFGMLIADERRTNELRRQDDALLARVKQAKAEQQAPVLFRTEEAQ